MKELRITEPGDYENILVDGEWGQHDLVRIGNCHIHHLLNQTFKEGAAARTTNC